MQYSGELTVGAIGIIISILTTGLGGICTAVGIYIKTRGDIRSLEVGYSDMKADVGEMKGEIKATLAMMHTQQVMLERVAARQEIMQTISNLPNELAIAIGKLQRQDTK